MVNGPAAAVAAQREETGYYALVRSMAAKTQAPERPTAPPPAPTRRAPTGPSAGSGSEAPAHKKHRVEWTNPEEPTIWLAVYYG